MRHLPLLSDSGMRFSFIIFLGLMYFFNVACIFLHYFIYSVLLLFLSLFQIEHAIRHWLSAIVFITLSSALQPFDKAQYLPTRHFFIPPVRCIVLILGPAEASALWDAEHSPLSPLKRWLEMEEQSIPYYLSGSLVNRKANKSGK